MPASQPVRKIPGTDLRARTDYRSGDGSVRHYTVLNAEGKYLGQVAYHPARVGRTAGYQEGHGVYDNDKSHFYTLAEAALAQMSHVTRAWPQSGRYAKAEFLVTCSCGSRVGYFNKRDEAEQAVCPKAL